jgi:hypothetical protein
MGAANFNPVVSDSTASPLADDLLAGDNVGPVTDGRATILTGQVLTRGALLGRVTASGKLALSTSAATHGAGSDVPVAILANDVDATGGDVTNALVYTSGEFNERKVIFGTGHTAASVRNALAARGIHLKDSVPA